MVTIERNSAYDEHEIRGFALKLYTWNMLVNHS